MADGRSPSAEATLCSPSSSASLSASGTWLGRSAAECTGSRVKKYVWYWIEVWDCLARLTEVMIGEETTFCCISSKALPTRNRPRSTLRAFARQPLHGRHSVASEDHRAALRLTAPVKCPCLRAVQFWGSRFQSKGPRGPWIPVEYEGFVRVLGDLSPQFLHTPSEVDMRFTRSLTNSVIIIIIIIIVIIIRVHWQ